jgi:ubiquinone biosynthesis protein COQ4
LLQTASTVFAATRAALANPQDTAQIFIIAEAMSFGTPERILRRFRGDPVGGALLTRRDDLLGALVDRAALEAMPAGSLARVYLAFLDREGISADGLIEASQVSPPTDDGDLAFVRERLRDTHDLWHAVTGYHGDLLGEAALLAFTFAQTGHPGVGFVAGLAFALSPVPEARRFIADGFARGRRARWLPAADWLALLPRPIDEVRAELGVKAVPDYPEVRESPFARR